MRIALLLRPNPKASGQLIAALRDALYPPSQTKEALEITEETLRYWRNKLAPLKGERGYAPCFLPGDLLALSVVTQLHALDVAACGQGVGSACATRCCYLTAAPLS